MAVAAPALFSANSSGKGNGAILNQDNTPNSPANPAEKGSVVVLFGTGEGQTNPRGVDGRIAMGATDAAGSEEPNPGPGSEHHGGGE